MRWIVLLRNRVCLHCGTYIYLSFNMGHFKRFMFHCLIITRLNSMMVPSKYLMHWRSPVILINYDNYLSSEGSCVYVSDWIQGCLCPPILHYTLKSWHFWPYCKFQNVVYWKLLVKQEKNDGECKDIAVILKCFLIVCFTMTCVSLLIFIPGYASQIGWFKRVIATYCPSKYIILYRYLYNLYSTIN